MQQLLSSHERMLLALNNQQPDHVPCCVMIFAALWQQQQCRDQMEFIQRQIDMGLDVRVELPELPIRFHPDVRVEQWKETPSDGGPALLHKRYSTPAGELTATVEKTEDWPYGDCVPLFDDYLIPRSRKFLVESDQDLESIRFLFPDPTADDIAAFRQQARQLKKFASDQGLLVSGGWTAVFRQQARQLKKLADAQLGLLVSGGWTNVNEEYAGMMGIDAVMWLCGMQQAVLLALDKPEMMAQLIQIIAEWNYKRMGIVLDEGVDLIMKRAWYEGTDLWSPTLYRRFILPVLREEVRLAHQAQTKFGYLITSGVMPILDDIIRADVDVLIGVDPLQGKWSDLKVLKQKTNGRMCLWGGVNNCLTIEGGSQQDVKEAVEEAITILGPDGGLILSPVENIINITDHTWDNVHTMIATWQAVRAYR